MSQFDILFIMISFFILIPTVLTCTYLWNEIFPTIEPELDPVQAQNLDNKWDQVVNFYDASFAALMIIMILIAIVLTVFLASHPVVLIIWLVFNVLILFVYDGLNDFLTDFLTSDLNTGEMGNAVNFWQGILPKLVPISSILVSIVMLGKRSVNL